MRIARSPASKSERIVLVRSTCFWPGASPSETTLNFITFRTLWLEVSIRLIECLDSGPRARLCALIAGSSPIRTSLWTCDCIGFCHRSIDISGKRTELLIAKNRRFTVVLFYFWCWKSNNKQRPYIINEESVSDYWWLMRPLLYSRFINKIIVMSSPTPVPVCDGRFRRIIYKFCSKVKTN